MNHYKMLLLSELRTHIQKTLRLHPEYEIFVEETMSADVREVPCYAARLSYSETSFIAVFSMKNFSLLGVQELSTLLQHHKPKLLVLSHFHISTPVPAELSDYLRSCNITLWVSSLPTQEISDYLNHYLQRFFAATLTQPGVFLNVLNTGVLLSGESGVGKSEIGFNLIYLGHQLVADDAVIFSKMSKDFLLGSCPPLLQDFLEIRGLGILNIRALMGDHAIIEQQRLDLIIRLKMMSHEQLRSVDRLQGIHSQQMILDVPIPEVTLPVAPGRSMAVLIEAAVRHHLLKRSGINPVDEFIQRQNHQLELYSS